MFNWLKRWRKQDELRGLSAAERRALWEERDRVERSFLEKLEKKLTDALPEQKAQPDDPPSAPLSPPPPLRAGRDTRGRVPREPYFGEIERFPRLVRSRPNETDASAPTLSAAEQLPDKPADRYEKIATELRSAKLSQSSAPAHLQSDVPESRSSSPLDLVMRAALFAAERHKNQRLKGAARDPYINHLLEVASLLADATDGADPDLVMAGLLREAIDDQVGTADIARHFGENVAGIVAEIAEDKDAGGGERRSIDLATIGTKSPRAQMIKIAELTSRVRAVQHNASADWPLERRREYIAWAQQVVRACRDANERLIDAFAEACGADAGAPPDSRIDRATHSR